MPHLLALGFQVVRIVRIRLHANRYLLDDSGRRLGEFIHGRLDDARGFDACADDVLNLGHDLGAEKLFARLAAHARWDVLDDDETPADLLRVGDKTFLKGFVPLMRFHNLRLNVLSHSAGSGSYRVTTFTSGRLGCVH